MEDVQALESERDELMTRVEELNAEIERLAGQAGVARTRGRGRGRRPAAGGRRRTARGTPRKRPYNEMNLVDALAKTLKGKTMSVTDVSEAVQQNGYRTSSANFRTIVNQTLINNPDRFERVGRGQYTAR